jgi:hypothetical protein
MSGGSVDWGHGCVISDAHVAVTVDDGAVVSEIRNVRVENTSVAGFSLAEDVRLVHDTVIGITSGKGVEIFDSDPVIDSSRIDGCAYGVYAVGSSAALRSNLITGPGTYGVYTIPGGEFTDTLRLVDNDVTGYFSAAHLYAGSGGNCVNDSCEFVADSTGGPRSPYGVWADGNAWVKLRRSKIKHYSLTGFYSDNSVADLCTAADFGQNSIYTTGCAGACTGSRVVHIFESGGMGPMGEGPLGPPPWEPLGVLDAVGNWWGAAPPDPNWFEGGVDYDPWLNQPPAGKVSALFAEEIVSATPCDFTVHQNYPNPFNPATVIRFDLPDALRVQVHVFNILGQVVATLVNREFTGGSHQLVWEGTSR